MGLEYITNRDLENSAGQLKGRIRILKTAEEPKADVELNCPECGNTEKRKEIWTEPFVAGIGKNQKFNLQCNKCGFKVKLLRLKKEIKKK